MYGRRASVVNSFALPVSPLLQQGNISLRILSLTIELPRSEAAVSSNDVDCGEGQEELEEENVEEGETEEKDEEESHDGAGLREEVSHSPQTIIGKSMSGNTCPEFILLLQN